MHLLKNPAWIQKYNLPFLSFDDIPPSVFEEVNKRLEKLQNVEPQVSIIISAWNEEVNILRCLSCLADSKAEIPLEIIVINNNSTDNTQLTLDKLHVKSLFQPIQGWGPARQMGMENAKGKYILLADADCFYPPQWVNEMVKALAQENVVCVYGRYSFIAEKGFPRWKLSILETMKDLLAEFKHIKRPYLNAYGMSYGFIKEYGLKIGFIMDQTRGDEGKMCFDLMKYGKVKQVRTSKARIWTGPRTLQKDGAFSKALMNRIAKEGRKLLTLFTPHPPHDTKAK